MASSLEAFCGKSPNNHTVWKHDVYGHCYEQLVFILTSHSLLAIVSAFYIDLVNNKLSSPNLKKSKALHARFVIALLCACMSLLDILLQVFVGSNKPAPVDYLANGVAFLSWLLLALYLWKLRLQDVKFVRTHRPVLAIWALTFLAVCFRLSTIIKQLRSHDESLERSEEAVTIIWTILQVLYMVTLLPAPRHTTVYHELGASSVYRSINEDIDEEEPLLPSRSASKIVQLGIAEDTASLLSKATFWWTRPLMQKGALGQLDRSDDVFFLPRKLSSHFIESYFLKVYPQGSAAFAEEVFQSDTSNHNEQLLENGEGPRVRGYGSTQLISGQPKEDRHPEVTIQDGKVDDITLRRALFRAFGVHFFLLGIVKFIANILIFAGPLLLNALVAFMEDKCDKQPMKNGYYYALGLFLSTFLSAMLGTHFNYQITRIQVKVRAALITTIYRKSLAVSATTLSAFTTGQIVNFMSVDTGRIVNFCNSFHAFWSLPFEVALSLYLLYRQVCTRTYSFFDGGGG